MLLSGDTNMLRNIIPGKAWAISIGQGHLHIGHMGDEIYFLIDLRKAGLGSFVSTRVKGVSQLFGFDKRSQLW